MARWVMQYYFMFEQDMDVRRTTYNIIIVIDIILNDVTVYNYAVPVNKQ